MNGPTAGRRASVLIIGGGLVLLAVGVTFTLLAHTAGLTLNPYAVTNPVIGVGYLIPAAVIARHRADNLLVVLLTVGGVGHLLAGIGVAGYQWGPVAGWPPWAVTVCLQLMGLAWKLGLGPPFALILLLFPDGRLPSRRWQWVVWATAAALALGVVGWFVAPDDLAMNVVIQMADLTVTVAAVVALVQRYRRGDDRVRGQILWLLLAVLVIVALNIERALTGRGPEFLLLSFVCVPLAIGIAIVRYELLDIRLVVSRTLLYGLLIAAVLVAYVGLVALTSALLPPDLSTWGPVTSAIAVALALNPVRVGLQRLITRLFYGRRSEPAAAAALIGRGLDRIDDLDQVLRTAQEALRLPYLAVHDQHGQRIAATAPAPEPGGQSTSLPLRSRGQPLGRLDVTLRAGESRLHRADAEMLALLVGPLTLLLRERSLVRELRDSRTQVVQARESERTLLHRDLHDGLGPTLTNAAFRADAAANRLPTDPVAAAALLAETRAGIRDALADVRRVVYGLRPLALEELGLVGALHEQAARAARLPVQVSAGVDLGSLDPAVELALYRIATESITNAQRHSNGTEVAVWLDAGPDEVQLVVRDNGSPSPGFEAGVGLRSVHERAEELGGRTDIHAGPQGWRVSAWIPTTR